MYRRFGRLVARRCGQLIASLCLLLGLCTVPARGQISLGGVNGTVFDSTGAVVQQAQLKLENLDTNLTFVTTTNEQGYYAFLAVPPGQYLLEVSKPGFRTVLSEPFVVSVGQTVAMDFTLELGPVEEVVSVEAAGSDLQAATAEVGGVVSQKQVADLPVRGRNFTRLLLLIAGVAPVHPAPERKLETQGLSEVLFAAISGQSHWANNFFVDGTNNTGMFASTYAVAPILDTVAELKIQTHNDKAEFGLATGATVNVLTHSGTNNFRGSAWEFIRNDIFEARNFFRPERTPLRQHLYGGTLGGPVLPSKTFFFVAVQGLARRTPASRLYRVPTERNLAGDLSDWPFAIYDPYSTRPDPQTPGRFVRDPFPANQIPPSRLDRGMLEYARWTIPQAVATGVAGFNQLDLTPLRRDQIEFSGRVDHALTRRNLFWLRGAGSISNLDGSGGRQTLRQFDDLNTMSIGLGYTRILSPVTLFQFVFSHTAVERDRGRFFVGIPRDFVERVGLDRPSLQFRSGLAILPDFQVAQFFSGGELHEYGLPSQIRQVSLSGSRLKGRHTWKFGWEWTALESRQILNEHGWTFDSESTADPRHPGRTGSPLASWLLDVPERLERRDYLKRVHAGWIASFYVQDSWKLTPRLMLNLGLRYDYTRMPKVGSRADGTIYTGNLDLIRGVYWLQAVPPACSLSFTAPCIPTYDGSLPAGVLLASWGGLLRDFGDNWQPRVGLAYRLGPRTALRGSFGVFFDSWPGVLHAVQNLGHSWPDVGQVEASGLNRPTSQSWVPTVSAKGPFPRPRLPAAVPFVQGGWFRDPWFRNTYSLQWSLGLQRELSRSLTLSVAYVGAGNRRLPLGGYYNVARTPGPGDPALRRPYPHIVATYFERSWGRGHYQGLHVQLRRRLSQGLTFTASYTWSKTIDLGCSGYAHEACAIQDPYTFNSDRGVAATDLPHVLTLSWVWELPFGGKGGVRTGNPLVDRLMSGWQLNGVALFRSGQPFTVFVEGDGANTGNRSGYLRPDVLGSPALAAPQPERWFRTEMFVPPAPYRFGNAGRNILRGDGRATFDLSVFRNFDLPWRDHMRLQLRVELYNAFNTPQFELPVANLSDPQFGRVVAATEERQAQLGVRWVF